MSLLGVGVITVYIVLQICTSDKNNILNFTISMFSTGFSVVPYLKKRMTHKFGWMALLPSGKTYTWNFRDMDHLTNITYSAKFYGFAVLTKRKASNYFRGESLFFITDVLFSL